MSEYTNKGTTTALAIVSRDPDLSGNFVCDGVADNVQIQQAIDSVNSLGGGQVYIKEGTYDIAAAITLYKRVRFIGDGRETVTFSVSEDVNCIEIDPAFTHAWYELAHFRIDMNRHNGHAIYSLMPSDWTWSKPYIHDIDIYDVETGYYGMYFLDHFQTNIKRISIYTYGGGINISKVVAGRAANLGNSYWEDIHILMQAANGVGIYCESEASGYIMNLMEFHRVQILGQPQNDPPAGTTGIYLRGVQNTGWYDLNIEDCHYGVHLDYTTGRDAFHNHFYAPYIYGSLTCAWYLEGAVHGTLINGGYTHGAGGNTYLYRDTTASDGKENNVSNHKFTGTGLLNWGRKTVIHNLTRDTFYGQIALPFGAVNGQNCIHPTQGGAAFPTSGSEYFARVMNYIVTISGGTVSDITIQDKLGNNVLTGVTSLARELIPRGYSLDVTWSEVPTTIRVWPWGD